MSIELCSTRLVRRLLSNAKGKLYVDRKKERKIGIVNGNVKGKPGERKKFTKKKSDDKMVEAK